MDDKDDQVPFRFTGKIDQLTVQFGPDEFLAVEKGKIAKTFRDRYAVSTVDATIENGLTLKVDQPKLTQGGAEEAHDLDRGIGKPDDETKIIQIGTTGGVSHSMKNFRAVLLRSAVISSCGARKGATQETHSIWRGFHDVSVDCRGHQEVRTRHGTLRKAGKDNRMKTQSRRSATAALLAHAGLFLTVLLAVTLSEFGFAAQAQSPKLQDQLEQTLRLAALDGRVERVMSSLDQGAAPDAVDPDGRTALMMAAYNGHTETVKLLLDRGAKVDAADLMGRTALMYAASGPFASTVKLLIARGADPNVRDTDEGFTALMFAAAEGQVEVIKVLLAHNADITIKDEDGDTALDFAEKNGHQGAVGVLKKEME